MKKLGFIVNPVAGMGGRVGLKGTDGLVDKARALGALPQSGHRARRAIKELEPLKNHLHIITAAGDMGETLVKEMGFHYTLIDSGEKINTETSAKDTCYTAEGMIQKSVDLILFAGGDGTARDLFQAVGENLPVIGIPAGVKIHSPVYATSPEEAGKLACRYLTGAAKRLKSAEVLDIDEEAYRKGQVHTRLYGYLRIPDTLNLMQGKKSGSLLSEESSQKSIALGIADHLEKDLLYLIGPGSTTRHLLEALSLPATLLGVDLICNGQLIGADLAEKEILQHIANQKSRIIITPIGGQGYLFGRGNQQFSPQVIQQAGIDNIIIMATVHKIQSLRGRPLLVDTGDPELDKQLSGYVRVRTGYQDSVMYRVK
ncbi:Predicted polyphosphate-or ATP-dependent NAD kinase [Tindallia magadiensis]|uniref:Predicted polyphosphate-or ATP-dependent NAD kinase n=1 Tax=Tindallia magadiensis TaxID=69895 RepID=A0A1I3EXE5_9FIRM|nr:ATP-NAD kinase family protein [Tindallia magadiensis]SFI03643.1 Predicted polyphosphate-or ATP-dependent NAD kinase [Tindallia magadiensis]